MIVVDSSVWIDRLNGVTTDAVNRLDQALHTELICVGDIILLEVLQGARDDLHARKLRRVMDAFRCLEMLNADIAIRSAANFRFLRGKGFTIRKTPDLIIGTWCIENRVPLLHSDRDFAPMVEHLGLIEF
ncbi:MAG: PIN domain nuclease [Hyphomicrobiales bacterium]|nr:MAG: PIN domain nuclease [Hyphomicrobiales bacterium]